MGFNVSEQYTPQALALQRYHAEILSTQGVPTNIISGLADNFIGLYKVLISNRAASEMGSLYTTNDGHLIVYNSYGSPPFFADFGDTPLITSVAGQALALYGLSANTYYQITIWWDYIPE